MLPIFVLSVINYVFMPIISTWDFKNMTEDDLQVSQGVYKDFNSNWFLDAGEVVITTMQFNILMPPIEFLLAWAFRYLFRAWDQRSFLPGNYRATRTKTVYEFADLYSGPEFFIHVKYSYILTVVYISFMFGPLLPILFISGSASLICLYMVEKLAMAFSYRKPPMYD